MSIYRLTNIIHNYSWGSYKAISNLLDRKYISFLPESELLMGINSNFSSKIIINSIEYSIVCLKNVYSIGFFRNNRFNKIGKDLPYLFKILAIDSPLSVQVHPNKDQAIVGYKKENFQKKAIDSIQRNYKDKNNKFESICALTNLWSMNGLRSIIEIQFLIEQIYPKIIKNIFERFKKRPTRRGLVFFLKNIIFLSSSKKKLLITNTLIRIKKLRQTSLVFEWIARLAEIFPDDIAIFGPVFLNLILIKQGEGILVNEGIIHAYLGGMCIEIMVNSNNVIRGGLTSKYIDRMELLNIANFSWEKVNVIPLKFINNNELSCNKNDMSSLSLNAIILEDYRLYKIYKSENIEILICTYGYGKIIYLDNKLIINIKKGDTILISSSVLTYYIYGKITIFKASLS